MKNYDQQSGSEIARTIILLLSTLCFLAVAAFVSRELRTESSDASRAYFYLVEPIALLIAAYSLWRVSLLGDAIACLASGWVVYTLFVDILWSIAAYYGLSVLSVRAFKEYWTMMIEGWWHYPNQPYYLMLLSLAFLILLYSLGSILRTFLRRCRASAHGI